MLYREVSLQLPTHMQTAHLATPAQIAMVPPQLMATPCQRKKCRTMCAVRLLLCNSQMDAWQLLIAKASLQSTLPVLPGIIEVAGSLLLTIFNPIFMGIR